MEREGLIERRRGAIVITDALRLSASLEAVSRGAFDAGRYSSPRRRASATSACVCSQFQPAVGEGEGNSQTRVRANAFRLLAEHRGAA